MPFYLSGIKQLFYHHRYRNMSTVSPLSGILPLGSSTSDSNSRGKFYHPRRGQIFKALVAEAKSPTMFILDIGGNKIPAQAKTPLTIGQTLKLQVMTTSPQIELKILTDSTNLLTGKSITLLGKNVDIRSLFQSLQNTSTSTLANISPISRQTLESFFLFNQQQLSGSDNGLLLKQLIDRLGISFESLLAKGNTKEASTTLKAALLELAQIFKGAEHIAEKTSRLLNTLELYQLAQLQLEKENVFIFPLPIPFLEKGYLLVEDKNESNDDNAAEDRRFSLHISLVGLGNLRIDVLKNPEGLFLRFISDSQKKLDFIRAFQDDLLLQMVGTEIISISFSLEPLDTAADLLKKLLPDGESLVNTKV